MLSKPNITDFETKRFRVLDILKRRNVPHTEHHILKFLNAHEMPMAELKVVLNYLNKSGEIKVKSSETTNKTKLYYV